MGRPPLDLTTDEIVEAACAIFLESGMDAVSMRTVSAQLGVSPEPLYKRIGNKEALLDAMAKRLLVDVAPRPRSGEHWQKYAMRWAAALHDRLSTTPDVRLLIGERREPFVEASRPLAEQMQNAGLTADAAVQACRLLIWATMGFVVVEAGRHRPPTREQRGSLPGSNPTGISAAEARRLFRLNLQFILDGLARHNGLSAQ
jgi:TetR/AcrR family transcriptional regulator, tetracycline repressor protein